MTLEKAKKKTKITKSQLQKQKQVQNVIVNLQAPVKKATRKRTTKPKPVQIPQKSLFQAPIYMPPVVSYNKQPDNNSILSDILKHMNKPKPESNELEKVKPQEKEAPKPPEPTLPPSLGAPQRRTSLMDEIQSDPMKTKQTLINTPPFEAPQQPFVFNAPIPAEPKPQTLVQKIQVGQEKKFDAPTKQPHAELETGGTLDLFGINDAQIKAHKEAGKLYTFPEPSEIVLTDEPRPTQEEIDLGIVPPIAQKIVQVDEPPILQIMAEPEKEEILIPEPIPTKANTQQIQMKALTMGEEKPFNKVLIPPPLSQFFVSKPQPSYKPSLLSQMEKSQLEQVKTARIKALDKPKKEILTIKPEAEPILSKETNQPLSPEKEAQIKEEDPEITKLSKLTNAKLNAIITGMGGNKTNQGGGKKNKQTLTEGILELRKTKGELFTALLSGFKN